MKVLINIYNPEDYVFFKRFYAEFSVRGWSIEYLANGILPYIYLKAKGETVFIARKVSERSNKNFSSNFSVLTERVTEVEAGQIYASLDSFLNRQYKKSHWDLVLIPSGRLINHVAISDFCNKHGIRKLFIGYGNIPNRTFVDPEGTDMASFLYRQPNVLEKWKDCEAEFSHWREEYLQTKFKTHVIGQARNVDFKLKLNKNIQIAACYIERWLRFVGENSYYFGKGQKIELVSMEATKSVPADYYFFPMQVSTDAQIILNYKEQDILFALDVMVKRANDRGVPLVVKPHPAEIDSRVLTVLNQYQKESKIHLVNLNTFDLIKGAIEVWTINSTVGLESMIVGRGVTFEGNSIYRSMSGTRLAAYIMKYLVKIEYFSNENITKEQFDDFFDEDRFLL